ncbi:MAG: hypothetical protein HWQ42_09475 [Nostoc sp. JL23]|nr:hypothetical protein [Nostoc sp. JL23]
MVRSRLFFIASPSELRDLKKIFRSFYIWFANVTGSDVYDGLRLHIF